MYHILPKTTLLQHAYRGMVCHYLDLPDGENVLAKVKFHFDADAAIFEKHSSVVSLPHVASSRKVGATVAKHLAHMGVTENHSTYDVAEKAAEIMRTMKYRD
jgi:hypothetical protein